MYLPFALVSFHSNNKKKGSRGGPSERAWGRAPIPCTTAPRRGPASCRAAPGTGGARWGKESRGFAQTAAGQPGFSCCTVKYFGKLLFSCSAYLLEHSLFSCDKAVWKASFQEEQTSLRGWIPVQNAALRTKENLKTKG